MDPVTRRERIREACRADYRQAAALTASIPERRYLIGRAAALGARRAG
ncbi:MULTISPECIES: hypothetical protein [unclassified Frankia]|nr:MULTISPECIES: hypothetical protein [unclassified Frankia]